MSSRISYSVRTAAYDPIHNRGPTYAEPKRTRIASTTQQVFNSQQNRSARPNHVSNRSLLPFNKQIKSALRASNVAKAWRIFNSIPNTLRPDVYTFSPFLSYYAKRKNIDELNRVCEIMKNNHIIQNVVTYTTL